MSRRGACSSMRSATFLEPERQASPSALADRAAEALSRRERDVLRLAADGRTNERDRCLVDASASGRSSGTCRTSTRSLGLAGRSARTAAVAEYLRHQLA